MNIAARQPSTLVQEMNRVAVFLVSTLLVDALGCSGGYADSAPLAIPGPMALSCENDVPCGTHHCNLVYGKCTFPCQSNTDCIAPNQCAMGLCVPPPRTCAGRCGGTTPGPDAGP